MHHRVWVCSAAWIVTAKAWVKALRVEKTALRSRLPQTLSIEAWGLSNAMELKSLLGHYSGTSSRTETALRVHFVMPSFEGAILVQLHATPSGKFVGLNYDFARHPCTSESEVALPGDLSFPESTMVPVWLPATASITSKAPPIPVPGKDRHTKQDRKDTSYQCCSSKRRKVENVNGWETKNFHSVSGCYCTRTHGFCTQVASGLIHTSSSNCACGI